MNSRIQPAEVIIVNDDADPTRLAEYDLNIVQIATTADAVVNENSDGSNNIEFDIGHNRNLGAAHATYGTLIFLDVDCIVAPTFIEQLKTKLQTQPNGLFMGQPRYLTRALSEEEAAERRASPPPAAGQRGTSAEVPYSCLLFGRCWSEI